MSNELNTIQKQENKYQSLINVLSIAIPVAVAVLIGIRSKVYLGEWTKVLPHVIGFINSVTSVLLVLGFYFIKQQKVKLHKAMMLGAFVMGGLFLVCYITYHISNLSTPFGGEGWIRPVYYFLLITHIVLSIGVVRLVLLAVYFALTNQILRHKKIVKYAFPIWLYVSVTGVIVYLMISPYYIH